MSCLIRSLNHGWLWHFLKFLVISGACLSNTVLHTVLYFLIFSSSQEGLLQPQGLIGCLPLIGHNKFLPAFCMWFLTLEGLALEFLVIHV